MVQEISSGLLSEEENYSAISFLEEQGQDTVFKENPIPRENEDNFVSKISTGTVSSNNSNKRSIYFVLKDLNL